MREILFRGKTILGEWIEGDLIQYLGWGKVHIAQHYKGAGGQEVIPETVGQYTGLTDKNGKKIFEGDIVNFKAAAYYSKKGKIKYKNLYARYCAIDNKGYEYPMDKTFDYEVIGNVFDNPELLKGHKT